MRDWIPEHRLHNAPVREEEASVTEFKAHYDDPVGAMRARDKRIAELETVLRDIALLSVQQVAGPDDPLLTIERLARNALSRQEPLG